jgi:hypothetical protein
MKKQESSDNKVKGVFEGDGKGFQIGNNSIEFEALTYLQRKGRFVTV